MNLLVEERFVDPAICQQVITGFRGLAAEARGCSDCGSALREFSTRTEIPGRALGRRAGRKLRRPLGQIRDAVAARMREHFASPDLFVEFTLLSEMREGDMHVLHADNEQRNEDGEWVANHTPWRAYAAMVYLNTSGVDFEGGVLRFPPLGREVQPRTGELVGFSCGHEHEHEVTPILTGRRYSIAIWLTRDPGRAERWKE